MRKSWIGVLALVVGCTPVGAAVSVDDVWEHARSAVPEMPSQREFTPEVCASVLAGLRAIRPPNGDSLDRLAADAVTRWLRTARSAFFECHGGAELEADYARLAQIGAELAVLLGEE